LAVYHVEIRQFPHNACRFNLTERELLPIAVPWAREEWVELGERKWNVNQATLTIVEGPRLSLPQLAMGRGWRNAQRQGQVVTDRVLETLKQAPGAADQATTASATTASATARAGERGPANPSAERAAADFDLLGDSLGLEILAALDQGPVTLALVWRLAGARLGDRPASEGLALGEQAIRSLLERGLVVLQALPVGTPVPDGREPALEDVAEGQLEPALRAIDGWAGGAQSALLGIRRA
jgi:hypothetical protein